MRERRLSATMWGCTDYIYTSRAVHDSAATMRFGFDPHASGEEFGMLIYCHGRLIRPYLRVGLQVPRDSDVRVVGIVEADFLTPTKNMQAFKRNRHYQGLLFSLDRWLKSFWQKYGSMQKVLQTHGRDPVSKWCRCDDCGYWRIVAPREGALNPDDISCQKWVCAFNLGGTTKCGPPDDDDILHSVDNEHSFGVSRPNPDTHKKPQDSPSEGDEKAAGIPQQLCADDPRKRSRAPQVPNLDWAKNGVAEGSSPSDPTSAAEASGPGINAHAMATVGDRMVSEPNLSLEQPLPELVSPQLHSCGNDVKLSHNEIVVQPQVPVSDAATLLPGSALLVPSTRDNLAPCEQIEAVVDNIEMKGTPLRGKVSRQTDCPIQIRESCQAIHNNLTNGPGEKLLYANSSHSLVGAAVSCKQVQELSEGNTLKSFSSTSHEEVFKPGSMDDSVVNMMAKTNGTNGKIDMNGEAAKHTPRSEKIGKINPKASSPLRETVMSQKSVQSPISPALLLTPPQLQSELWAQRHSKRGRCNADAFVPTKDYQSDELPSHTDVRVETGDDDGFQGARVTERVERRVEEEDINDMDIDKGVEVQHLTPSRDRSVITLYGSDDTPRYGGFRYVRGMKGKGRPGSGRSPIQSTDEEEMRRGVPMSQALRENDCFDVNVLNVGDGSPTDNVLRNKRDAMNQAFTSRKRIDSVLPIEDVRGEAQDGDREQNFDILQAASLYGIDMSKLLGLVEGEVSKIPQLHLRADTPVLEPTKGRTQRIGEEYLPDRTKMARATSALTPPPAEGPLLFTASKNEQVELERTEIGKNSPQLKLDEAGNDETEPFEKQERDQPHSLETNAEHHVPNFCAPIKRQRHSLVLRERKNSMTGDVPSPNANTAETICDSANRERGSKRRLEGEPSSGDVAGTPLSSGQGIVDGSHYDVGDDKTNSDGSQRGSQNEKRRRVASDPLAVATEAAASAAQVALGNVTGQDFLRHGTSMPSTNLPVQMTWSQIAISAAVAAGAATAAAMAAKQSRAPSILEADRNREEQNAAPIKEEKLKQVVSLLGPMADGKLLDNTNNLAVEGESNEIAPRVCQVAKESTERAISRQLESCRAQLQTQTNALQKVRKLVHIFLDKVVGILQTDDSNEPIENQLEYYLRLVDVFPPDTSN